MIFRLFFIVFFCLMNNASSAQYYNLTFKNHSSYNGLSQGEIEAVFEDSRGFIWVGSRFGLTRYDGKEFRNFYHHVDDSSSLGDNIITAIDEDSEGNLWMSLYNTGFCKMNPMNSKFENFFPAGPGSLVSEKVETLIIDHHDRIWLGTEKGISIFDPKKGTYTNITHFDDQLSQINVLSFGEDEEGNIWVGTKTNGLWLISPETFHARSIATYSQVNSIKSIYVERDRGKWIASSTGLYEVVSLKDTGYQVKRAAFFPFVEKLEDVEVDEEGNVWMATQNDGLRIYFPKTGFLDVLKENFSSARGLLSNRLMQVYQDSRGGIWLGGENGLQYFHSASQKFNIYPGLSNISDQLRGSTLYGIFEVDNDLLMASSGGILVYNRVSNRFIPVKYFTGYHPGSIRFRSFNKEGQDRWWVCSDQGIYELRREKNEYVLTRPARLKNLQVFAKESFRNYVQYAKGEYWFGMTEKGVLYWNQSKDLMVHLEHKSSDKSSLGNDVINLIGFDRDSTNILVGTDSGFSIIKRSTLAIQNFYPRARIGAAGLNNRYVYDFYDDGKKFWLATYGGGINSIDKRTGISEILYNNGRALQRRCIYVDQ